MTQRLSVTFDSPEDYEAFRAYAERKRMSMATILRAYAADLVEQDKRRRAEFQAEVDAVMKDLS